MRIIIELKNCKDCEKGKTGQIQLSMIAHDLLNQLTQVSATIHANRQHIKSINIEE